MVSELHDLENKKIKMFAKSIMENADARCEQIHAEMVSYEHIEMEKLKRETRQEAKRSVQSEVKEIESQFAREAAEQKAQLRSRLYGHRQQLSEGIFDKARAQLCAYVKGEGYGELMRQKAQRIKAQPLGDRPQVYVRLGDEKWHHLIEESLGKPCDLIVTDQIEIGGLIAVNPATGFRVDQSLDSSLRAQRAVFCEHEQIQLTF